MIKAREWSFPLTGTLFIALAMILCLPGVGIVLAGLGTGLHDANIVFIEQSKSVVSKEAVFLGESFALLKILSSAQLGAAVVVDAQVTVGATLSTLTLAVEDAMGIAQLFLASIDLWEAILTYSQVAFLPLIVLASGFLGLSLLFHQAKTLRALRHFSRQGAYVALLGLILTYGVIPYSFNIAGKLTEGTTETGRTSAPEELHKELTRNGATTNPSYHWLKDGAIVSSLKVATRDSAAKISAVQLSARARLTHLVMLGAVLPLLSALSLWLLIWQVLRYAFEAFDRDWRRRLQDE